MTYLFKLAKRLSSAGPAALLLQTAILVGCAPAEDRDLLGTTPATVSAPVALSISPRAGSVKPGEEIRFTAAGRSVAGGTVPVDVEWQADGGTITADGRFVAPQHGQFRVTAKARQYPHLADSALVAVFNAPTDILLLSVTPDSSLITEGEGIQLLAEARLADGSTSQRPPVRWSATGGRVDGSGWFSSLEPGDYRVEAISTGGVRGQATILVRPNIRITSAIEIAPRTLSLTYGETRQLRATARFADGSEGQAQVLWSATGGTIGTDGVFSAGSATGNFRIIARTSSSGIADTAAVSITEPPMTAVLVSPTAVTLLPGATHQFVATAVLGNGSTRSVGVAWSATGGAIQASGHFAAGQAPGTYRVVAAVPGTSLTDTAVVQVVNPATVLEQVVLNPRTASVPLGTSRQFTVTGVYADGATRTPAVTWAATGGTISNAGTFTPGTAVGTYRVIATAPGGKADTSVVTVAPPELQQVVLNPSAVTLTPGATRAFAVSGRWSDGSATAPAVVYQAEGGTITPEGTYTAGEQPGTWRLIARQSGGMLADTALITIEPPAPQLLGVTVSPKTAAVQPGQSITFSVLGRWSTGGSAPPPVTWVATGGRISAQGIFTAGEADGSYLVVVRTADGRHADTSRVSVATAAPTLTTVALSPRQTALQTGGTRQFYVSGRLSDGSASVPAVTWSASSGTITNGGLYVASVAGTHRVIATQQGGRLADTALVTVTDPLVLTGVQVTPDSAVVQAGESLSFSALGVWSNGATGSTGVTWSATGGSVSAAGVFTAGATAGTYRVIARATALSLADTAAVRVQAAPTVARLRVNPATGSIAAGATLQFAVEATHTDGVVRPAAVSWSATGGTITGAGLYTAGATGGTFRVIATSGSVADTAAVSVTVAPVVTRFVLSPDSLTLAPSGTQQFNLAVVWSDGATRPVTVTYSATGGTVTSNGNYVAGAAAGRFLVVALCACGAADTSVVTIAAAPPALGAIRVTPDSADLMAGSRLQFAAVGVMSDGSTSTTAVSWSASGGAIDTAGMYVAPAEAGTYRVVARHLASGKSDTARVTVAAVVAGSVQRAELPRTRVNVAYPAVTGRRIAVAEGGNLQAAVDMATCGDEIVLANGAVFRAQVTLRARACDRPTIIRSASVPVPEGVRMTPAAAQAARLARIESPGGNRPAIVTEAGANHYRLVGLEVAMGTSQDLGTLVQFGTGEGTIDALPRNIVIDRSWIHGERDWELTRCVAFNGRSLALIHSWVAECHDSNQDSQAVAGWNGSGPFRIENNYLQAAGENILFGGADSRSPDLLPADIEILRNHIHKPTQWRGGRWVVKNLVELKVGLRVLIEGNVIENVWVDGQTGFAVLLKSANQGGGAPWSETRDVTVRLNVVRGAEGGAFNLAADPSIRYRATPMSRVTISGNLLYQLGTDAGYTQGAKIFLLGSGIAHLTIEGNTGVGQNSAVNLYGDDRAFGFRYTNNVMAHGAYGVFGPQGVGTVSLSAVYDGMDFGVNGFFGGQRFSARAYPSGTLYAASMDAVRFRDPAGGDFTLMDASPFRGRGTAGVDLGVSMPALRQATAGVVSVEP